MKKNSNPKFQQDYSNLKEWNEHTFGKLKYSSRNYFLKLLKKTKKDFNENSNILEIGFGNGSFLEYAKEHNWQVQGTELNYELVNIAKKRGFKAFCSDNLECFEDTSFDLIVAFDVLEHIDQDNILTLLNQVKNVLKHDGIFLSRFPNGDSPFGLAIQNGDVTHVTALGTGKIKQIASYLNMTLVFSGSDVEVIFRRNPISTLRNLIALFIKGLLNFVIYFVFHRKNFCSGNLIIILKK